MDNIYYYIAENFYHLYIGLIIVTTFIAKYLVVNKIWVRKHEPEVADSVSIIAVILEITILLPFLVKSALTFSYESLLLEVITIASHLFIFFIGVGIWVNNGLGFRDKFARTFKIERKEYKSLIKDAFHTKDMNKIFSFICMLSILDREIQDEEEVLLKKFADDYGLNYQLTMSNIQGMYGKGEKETPILLMKTIRSQISSFLDTSPPKEVVIYLEDIISHLVQADKNVTDEEQIVLDELKIMLKNYLLGNGDNDHLYYIVVVPQTDEQEEALLSFNSRYKDTKKEVSGTKNAYLIDSYHSQAFAEMVKDKYIGLFNCFVTVEKIFN